MTSRIAAALAAAPLLLLAACGDEEVAVESDDGRSASGEVLEGTIDDAMLPLDAVRSQPPLLDPEAAAELAEEQGEEAAPEEEVAE